jgi:predicted esterase
MIGGLCKRLVVFSIVLGVSGIMLARLSTGLRQKTPLPTTPAAAKLSSTSSPSAAKAFSSAAAGSMPSSLKYRAPIVVPARQQPHTATVVVLHGLGDTGDGWAGAAPELAAALPHARFVFPHAPERPISLNMGMRMPGWYDIKSLEDIDQREDREGILESQRYVLEELVGPASSSSSEGGAGAAAGNSSSSASSRTAVVGFSQGGAIALAALRGGKKLAGVVGMSTYVPLRKEAPVVSAANADTPVLLCHGDADAVVAYDFGIAASELLKNATKASVEFRTYRGMAHSACPEELRDVAAFLKKVLPPV